MPVKSTKLLSLVLSFCLILEQSAFAQTLDLFHYFANPAKPALPSDKFRPLHLRYLGYDNLSQDFKILLDKGDTRKEDIDNKTYLEENTQTLLKYFFIGLALPNDKFWVNLRPDSPETIMDDDLAKTDIGRIFLEADVQLKKDTAQFTSPQTLEGKEYWDKLYKKAGELFGTENITIPILTRPWIVPNEIIIREAPDNAYIYKATLKVMLEEDYLTERTPAVRAPHRGGAESGHSFSDPRLKELNEYSTHLIKELIIPKLTYQVNTSKRYAPLRQVYYSLILAQWFKQKLRDGSFPELLPSKNRPYYAGTIPKIDSGDLTNLISKEPYDKQAYFKQYQKSFQDGEYNLTEPVYTPMGQSVRRYMSGGIKNFMNSSPVTINARRNKIPKGNGQYEHPIKYPVLPRPEEESWDSIMKGLKNIKNEDGNRKYFADIKTEKVFYGEAEKVMRLARVGNHQGYDLAQIENMFFIDEAVHDNLSKYLSDDLKRRIIIVPNLFQSMIGQSEQEGGIMKKFTAAAILSMLNSDIAGKCVIDAGAGDGMLALAAARLGASQIIVIENDPREIEKAKINLESNGFKKGIHFWLIAEDLADKDAIIRQLPLKIKNNIVLVSNIGTWPLDYGQVTNSTSLELVSGIAKELDIGISNIILGGYEAKMPVSAIYGHKTSMDNEYKKHRPDNDIKTLKKMGFKVLPEISQVEKYISISAVSSAISPRLNDLLNSIDSETIPGVRDKKIREIFEILSEDSAISLSAGEMRLLLDKMKYCGESFSFENVFNDYTLDKLFSGNKIPAEELLSLLLELVYSTKSRSVRDNFLGAIAFAPNINRTIKLSQKQFDGLMDFMAYYLPGGKENSDARGWTANILSAALSAGGLNVGQKRLNAFISKAFENAELNFDNSLIVYTGPDDSNITMGIDFIVTAIKKNKELVIGQEYFDILLELVPKVIDFRNPKEEIRDALKLILRKNRNLQLINDSFRENKDIMDFCNHIIKVVKEGKEAKVRFVSAELSDKFGKEIKLEAYDLKDLENSIGEEIGYHNLGRVDIYINNKNMQDLFPGKLLEPGMEITIKSRTISSPMVVTGGNQEDFGGIAGSTSSPSTSQNNLGGVDFNALPIQSEYVVSSALGSFPGVKAFQGDIEAEWGQIQAVFNAGIRPSIQRMSEYTAAAASSGLSGERIDLVRAMLADILRREEEDERLPPAEPALKNLITALES